MKLAALLVFSASIMLGQVVSIPAGGNLLATINSSCSPNTSTTCYVILPNGYVHSGMTYVTGYEATRPNVVVRGTGTGSYYSTTQSTGDYIVAGTGSVIQCSVELTTGANNWKLEDLSVDVGDALVSSGVCPEGDAINAYSPYDKTDEPPIESFSVHEVTVLGRSAVSQFHGIKCENVNNCAINNSSALFSTHGFVGKFGTGFSFDNLWSSGHYDDCMIMKAGTDSFPVVAYMDDVEIRNITCESAQPNDTLGIYLQAANGSMENITISNINMIGTQEALIFSGDNPSKGFEINNVTVNDVNFVSGPYIQGAGVPHTAVLVEGLVGTATINDLYSYGADNCYLVFPQFSEVGSMTFNNPVCKNSYGIEFATGGGGTTMIQSPVIVHTPAKSQPTIKCPVAGGISGACKWTSGSGLWYNPAIKFSGCTVNPSVKFVVTNNAVSGVQVQSAGSGCPGTWITGKVTPNWSSVDFYNQGADSDTTVTNPTFNGLSYETIGTEAVSNGGAPLVVIE